LVETFKELVRGWFEKIWKVRGGGLYAVGWAVTFAWLEVTTIIGEILDAEGVVDFFVHQLLEFMLRFMGDSLKNMVLAFMWPAFVVQWKMPVGLILLGVAFALFPTYVKPYLEKWLFPHGDPDEWYGEQGDDKSEP
jgi:hypothetical protein